MRKYKKMLFLLVSIVPTYDSNGFLKKPDFLSESVKNDVYVNIDLMGDYTLTTNNDFLSFMAFDENILSTYFLR